MKVYRIEHPEDKQGFWTSEKPIYWNKTKVVDYYIERYKLHPKWKKINDRHTNPRKFPTYLEDEELKSKIDQYYMQDYFFAFKTIKQLREAFTKNELKEAINDIGFRILQLEVKNFYCSKFQVLFKDPISSIDITERFLK